MPLTPEEKRAQLRAFAQQYPSQFLNIVLAAPDALIDQLHAACVSVYVEEEARREAGGIDSLFQKPYSPFLQWLIVEKTIPEADIQEWVDTQLIEEETP